MSKSFKALFTWQKNSEVLNKQKNNIQNNIQFKKEKKEQRKVYMQLQK